MMDTHRATARTVLGFSVHGLSPRDETLFKSYLRFLDHRTDQHWQHQQDHADMRVVADGASASAEDTAAAPCQLTIGSMNGSSACERSHFICLPFKPDQLEAELNALGALALSMRTRHAPSAANAAVTAAGMHAEGELLRLARWPNPQTLRTPDRLRLATLMTGRPFTEAAIMARAGSSAAACNELLAELRAAGLLVPATGASPIPKIAYTNTSGTATGNVKPAVQPGLLARIRTRLGMSSFSLS